MKIFKLIPFTLTCSLISIFWITLNSCNKGIDNSGNSLNKENVQLITPSFYDSTKPASFPPPTSFLIDSKGNKWMGYDDGIGGGIVKFDGTRWERFNNSNIPVPLQMYVRVQTESKDGSIYFLTWDGNEYYRYLIRYKAGRWDYWSLNDFISAKRLFTNPLDDYLYFYESYRIEKAKQNSNFEIQSSYQTLASVPYSVGMDGIFASGNFYISGESRAYKVSPLGDIETLPDLFGMKLRVASSANGDIYSVAGGTKIYKLEGQTWKQIPYEDIPGSSGLVLFLAIDKRNIIYLYGYGGIGKIVDGKISYYKVKNNRIFTAVPILIDHDNVKWIAAFNGLVRISD